MEKTAISTDKAPRAIGPYSQAVKYGDLVFVSGQIAIDPNSGKLIDVMDVGKQTEQVMQNIKAILNEAGLDFSHVIRVTMFLTSMDDTSVVNEVYAQYFSEPYPARAIGSVSALPMGARLEIELVAGS